MQTARLKAEAQGRKAKVGLLRKEKDGCATRATSSGG